MHVRDGCAIQTYAPCSSPENRLAPSSEWGTPLRPVIRVSCRGRISCSEPRCSRHTASPSNNQVTVRRPMEGRGATSMPSPSDTAVAQRDLRSTRRRPSVPAPRQSPSHSGALPACTPLRSGLRTCKLSCPESTYDLRRACRCRLRVGHDFTSRGGAKWLRSS